MHKIVSYALMITLVIAGFTGCKKDDGPDCDIQPSTKSTVKLRFKIQYNGADLKFRTKYKNDQNQDFTVENFKFYLSDVQFFDEAGKMTFEKDVIFLDLDPNRLGGVKDFAALEMTLGKYSKIKFGLGVKKSLNEVDPATYELSHPLSINNGMYWTWSTQYRFIVAEGDIADKSWLVHPGTDPLYRPGIEVQKPFTLGSTEEQVDMIINFNKVLKSDSTLDLYKNGNSHTTDNLPLATAFIQNVSKSFE